MTYSCARVGDAGRRPRGGPDGQARAGLPEARPPSPACGSSTSAAAGAAWCCTPPPQHGVRAVGVTISERQADLAKKRVAGGRPGRPGRDPPAGLPRRRRRPVRRHQLDRHVRARRAASGCTPTSASSIRLLRPEGRLLNHGIGRPAKPRDRRPVRLPVPPWPSGSGLHRPLRLPRRRAARGRHRRLGHAAGRLRGAPPREPARALRPHAAGVGRQPRRRRWDEAVELSRPRAGPGCGGSTWRRRRSASRPARIQVHQVLAREARPRSQRPRRCARRTSRHSS